jgi:xylulokinase
MTGVTDHVIGVDVGSSGARAIAVDAEGTILAEASAPYDGATTWERGYADPGAWLDAVGSAHAAVSGQITGTGRARAVGIGGQNPTTVDADGTLAVTYRHPEGSTDSLAGDYEAQHRVLRREVDPDATPFQVWPWIVHRLGGCGHVQGLWPGLEPIPGYGDPVPAATRVGEADGGYGVPQGTPLVFGGEDAYLAFWAAGIDSPGRGLDPGGRTGGLGVAVDSGELPATMYSLSSAAEGVSIVGGPVTAHGLILEWWASLTGTSVPALVTLAADSPAGANGVMALPYLDGERAPRWNPDLRAELVGMGSGTTAADIARALLEATAYGLAHIARDLNDAAIGLDTLVCAGSPSRSRLWCTIKASVLEVPVEIPRYPELAAYGAALSAGAACGWWPVPGAGAPGDWPRPPVEVIDPQPAEVYRSGIERFIALGDESSRRIDATRDDA